MDPRQECGGGHVESGVGREAGVDEPLHLDVRPCLELQVPRSGLGGILLPHRAVDAGRMGVVSLDEVRVIAIHRAHQLRDCGEREWMEMTPELPPFLEDALRRRPEFSQIGDQRFQAPVCTHLTTLLSIYKYANRL